MFASLVDSGLVKENVDLSDLTTYKVGGPARLFADVRNPDDLQAVMELIRERQPTVLLLGRGSNLVISDRGFDGLVIRLGGRYATASVIGAGRIEAGGGMSLPTLARYSVKQDRAGLEFLVGIPGSVGGAVRMNAGCHGSEIADVIDSAEVVDLRSGSTARRTAPALELAYRSSNLHDHEAVASAVFLSTPGSRLEGEERMREVTRWRREHQPGGTRNAGSVFKNPPGDAAGRIIDELGLKGLRVGRVAVSRRHANFFEADRGASAQEVYELVHSVQEKVLAATGILLEQEIR
ncbi:MAG TPA: UDP-N-acetylmuramate dehydrogenase, partial [Acidimicrobiia bacterium]